MNYPEFYQWAVLFYLAAIFLLLAISSWWLRVLPALWRLALLGSLLLMVAYPVAPFEGHFAPLFIHFGFQLVDSGFDLIGQWPLLLPLVLALLVFNMLLLLAALLLRLRPKQQQDESKSDRPSAKRQSATRATKDRGRRNRTLDPY